MRPYFFSYIPLSISGAFSCRGKSNICCLSSTYIFQNSKSVKHQKQNRSFLIPKQCSNSFRPVDLILNLSSIPWLGEDLDLTLQVPKAIESPVSALVMLHTSSPTCLGTEHHTSERRCLQLANGTPRPTIFEYLLYAKSFRCWQCVESRRERF